MMSRGVEFETRSNGVYLLQPSMSGCKTAISEAWAASSISTFSKASFRWLKMRRPVLDSVVNTISASWTNDSSRLSFTWRAVPKNKLQQQFLDVMAGSDSCTCIKVSFRRPSAVNKHWLVYNSETPLQSMCTDWFSTLQCSDVKNWLHYIQRAQDHPPPSAVSLNGLD